jgi:hypothetical protein
MPISFADPVIFEEPSCLDDLSPKEKIEYFVKGMQDNAIDLVKFRADPELASFVAAYEVEIWNAMNALQFIAASIRCEREAKVKRKPTIIMVK